MLVDEGSRSFTERSPNITFSAEDPNYFVLLEKRKKRLEKRKKEFEEKRLEEGEESWSKSEA